jgi:hypothetical protein
MHAARTFLMESFAKAVEGRLKKNAAPVKPVVYPVL